MAPERELSHVGVEVSDPFETILSESDNVRKAFRIIFIHNLVFIKVFLFNYLRLEYLLLKIVFEFSLATSLLFVLRLWALRGRNVKHRRMDRLMSLRGLAMRYKLIYIALTEVLMSLERSSGLVIHRPKLRFGDVHGTHLFLLLIQLNSVWRHLRCFALLDSRCCDLKILVLSLCELFFLLLL